MSTIPTLTEQNIRTFVGEHNFQKGQQLVHDGAIVHPEQQAMALKAYCYGSLPEPHRVQITFDSTGITSALCSCSTGIPTYGNRGCEHAATLLLAWNEQPEAFTQTDGIDIILERQSKAQLITLIKQVLQKQPEVEWQLIFHRRPWFAEYQKMREISMELGNWEAVRQEALTFLETTKNISTLVEAALDERDIERALQLLKATTPPGPEGYQWQYDYVRTPDVALKAAEHAEEIYPHASIDLYQQHVERLIAGRGRSNYQIACSYLVKIRSLYEKLDETEQWTTYIAWLRKRHSRLSTLKEELASVGL